MCVCVCVKIFMHGDDGYNYCITMLISSTFNFLGRFKYYSYSILLFDNIKFHVN